MSDDPGASPRQSWERLPWLVRDAVVWSACLLVVAAALYLLARLAVRLAPLAIALAATLFLAALLDPLRTVLGRFGFRPALASLMPAWQDRRLAFVHACGAPDESRSHFQAMELMERGVTASPGPASGWIGRHLASVDTGNIP